MKVTMYSRPTCGLCDEAREAILEVRSRVSFDYEEVSIEDDEALEREYGVRIPVVLVNGEEQFELQVDPQRLAALLG